MRTLITACRGIGTALRARPGWAAATAAVVLVLQALLPAVVLSLARKPWTYFTFNPWLKRLPEYLTGSAALEQKLDFLTRVALFWFTADGPYGAPEWGFAVDTMDLLRFLLVAGLVGVYVALWRYQRDLVRLGVWKTAFGRTGGAVGAFAGVLGLSTGPCSVVGCGAPVLPVVGLAFAGLSSGTIVILSEASRVAVIVVLIALVATVGYLGWRVGDARRRAGPD